jgi:DNA-binding transcriptional ArsR family regulator
MLKRYELPPCPVETAVTLMGDRWKVLIVRDLLIGTKRFGELRKSLEGISQKVLTQHLRIMEENGLVHISQMADRFVSDPNEIVSMHQHVQVKIISVDMDRKRIQLSLVL